MFYNFEIKKNTDFYLDILFNGCHTDCILLTQNIWNDGVFSIAGYNYFE